MNVPGEPTRPVRVVSDLHLAHPASHVSEVASLRPLLEGVSTVVFNGDTCEQKCLAWKDKGTEMLAELRALCGKVGVEPLLVAGNHDGELAAPGWLDLCAGALFVTHGHMIYREVAPWSHEFLRRRKELSDLVEELRRPDEDLSQRWEATRQLDRELVPQGRPRTGRRGAGYLWSILWPPERLFQIMRVRQSMIGDSFDFLDRFRPEAGMMLAGHFHRPGVWCRDGRHLVNTGAFMRGSFPLAVDVGKGWVRVRRVERKRAGFQPGPTIASFRLVPRRPPAGS